MHVVDRSVVVVGTYIVDFPYYIHSFDDFTKHGILSVEMWRAAIFPVVVTYVFSHLHLALRCLIYAFLHSVEGQLAKGCAIDNVEV